MNFSTNYSTTVVFADVAGSSKLYKEVGDQEANRRIGAVVQEISNITIQHDGIVIKTIGDEVMCHFKNADRAFEAIVAMQQAGAQSLPLRIGLTWGPVIEKNADIFGEAVNDAAAVAKIARARQIITTEDFFQQLDVTNQTKLSQFDDVKLKGGEESTKLYRIDWEVGSSTLGVGKQTVIMSTIGALQNELVLSFHYADGRTDSLTLTPGNVPLHIGRDNTECKLAINSPTASRDHCHIDYQYGKFVLVDHSTNGTYVKNADGQQVYLRRQETPLLGKGEIALGEMVNEGSLFVINFYS